MIHAVPFPLYLRERDPQPFVVGGSGPANFLEVRFSGLMSNVGSKPLLDECISLISPFENPYPIWQLCGQVEFDHRTPQWGICANAPDFEPSLAYRSSYGKDIKVRVGGH